MSIERAKLIFDEAIPSGYLNAHNMGRMAHALDTDRACNPFPKPRPTADVPVGSADWQNFERGWNEEAALHAEPMSAERIKRELEAHRDAIAKRRDALRDLQGDVEALAESAGNGVDHLVEAIDALSELA
jgi:hypothetical protein